MNIAVLTWNEINYSASLLILLAIKRSGDLHQRWIWGMYFAQAKKYASGGFHLGFETQTSPDVQKTGLSVAPEIGLVLSSKKIQKKSLLIVKTSFCVVLLGFSRANDRRCSGFQWYESSYLSHAWRPQSCGLWTLRLSGGKPANR